MRTRDAKDFYLFRRLIASSRKFLFFRLLVGDKRKRKICPIVCDRCPSILQLLNFFFSTSSRIRIRFNAAFPTSTKTSSCTYAAFVYAYVQVEKEIDEAKRTASRELSKRLCTRFLERSYIFFFSLDRHCFQNSTGTFAKDKSR